MAIESTLDKAIKSNDNMLAEEENNLAAQRKVGRTKEEDPEGDYLRWWLLSINLNRHHHH